MALNHYWTRAAFVTSPASDDPSIGGSNLLGQVSANRTSEDVLLRTRMRGSFRFNVVSTTPPPVIAWPKMHVAFWGEYQPNSAFTVGSWPDGITDLIIGNMPSPVMYPHIESLASYTVRWDTADFVNSFSRRTGVASEGNFPGVNMAYQLFDESGITFPPIRFTQTLEFYGWLEVLWGSTA